jgi:hypothetical protein
VILLDDEAVSRDPLVRCELERIIAEETERLRVYDRAGQLCPKCRTPIRRLIQSARSTFFCPSCQRANAPKSGGKFIDAARRGL